MKIQIGYKKTVLEQFDIPHIIKPTLHDKVLWDSQIHHQSSRNHSSKDVRIDDDYMEAATQDADNVLAGLECLDGPLQCYHKMRRRHEQFLLCYHRNYLSLEIHPRDWCIHWQPETRPLCETHIPPVLSAVVRHGAFSPPSEITSCFPRRHKGLAMVFSY